VSGGYSRGGPGGDPLHRVRAEVRRRAAHGAVPSAAARVARAQRQRLQGQRGASPAQRSRGLITGKKRRSGGVAGPRRHLMSASVPVFSWAATRAPGAEAPFPAARALSRGGATGAAAGAGNARLVEMDIAPSLAGWIRLPAWCFARTL
jgi:hypothetical protein